MASESGWIGYCGYCEMASYYELRTKQASEFSQLEKRVSDGCEYSSAKIGGVVHGMPGGN